MDYVLLGRHNKRYANIVGGVAKWPEKLSEASRFPKDEAKAYEVNHCGLGDVLAIPVDLAAVYCFDNDLNILWSEISKYELTHSTPPTATSKSHLRPPFVLFIHTSSKKGYLDKAKGAVTTDLYVSYVYHTLEEAEADASKYATLKPTIVPVDKAPQNSCNFDPASLLPEPPLPPGAIDYFAMIHDLCGQ